MYNLSRVLLGCLMSFSIQISAQIMPMGSGSYTLQLPPPDAAGRNMNPAGIPRISGAALTKPIATSDWWTGLLTNNDATNGANLYNYPMSLKGGASGLVLSYTFLGGGANDTRQPMSPDQPLVLGVSGLTGIFPTVSDYSDWTVTASWNSSGHSFNATIGMGMPFVYCTKGSSDVASVTINAGTVTVLSEMILVTNSLSGSNFAVYAPVGSTWTVTDKTFTSTLAGKNYFSVAMLPPGTVAATAANDFKQFAYVFPSSTDVKWSYDNNTSTVRSVFSVIADVKEGAGTMVLLGLLPHQWAHLGGSSPQPQPGYYHYNTSRGEMKLIASNTFSIENKFKGILSTLPNLAKYSPGFDPASLNSKIELVKGEGLALWTDSYNEGIAMNRLIQVAKIADQTGNLVARDQIVNTVKNRLENWFKADPGENAFLFYYNTMWTTLIGYPAGYSADANLNDHHFHYGYFISAAAAIEQFQPGWAAKWGPMVNMLIRDVANWDKSDTKFPFLRNFNPYAGHSFASGLLNTEPHGNNQESSSEAMNFNASLINWGELTGNNTIRDLGIYLYTTEQTGIEEYWFNMNKRNFGSGYSQMMCSRVWNDGYDNGTFWTGDIAAMYGIEMFPLTGSSLYLGHNITYVQNLWNDMKVKTAVLSNTPNDNLWYDIYWSYLALADAKSALTLYNAYPGYKPKGGCSDAQTYHWLHSLDGSGSVDASVTANYPIAMTFNKSGDKTYVAHNYGTSEITVDFSDGFSMPVPGRTMKTSKDIAVTAALSASASKVAKNGNVTLSSVTTGSGITKVEFFDGDVLTGTSTTAPYSVTATNLEAKVHSFFAKVYIGNALQLSNIVSVIVGSQLPYSGTAVSIPSQIIEAGNYDSYEGGIGQNITYFDFTPANEAGTFRSPEYVDAGPAPGEGNTVSFIENGEWLTYSVNIAQSGTYDLSFRYTSGNAAGGGPFHIEVDGTTVAANIIFGFTDTNWNSWTTKLISGIILPAGQHVLKLVFDNGGFNIGRMSFTYKGIASPALSVSATTLSIPMMAASSGTFDILSNIGWTLTSDQSWLNVSSLSGFGNSTITVTAMENRLMSPRTALIKVSGAGMNDQIITVIQQAGGMSYLMVSPDNLPISDSAGTETIDINSNVSWKVVCDQSWLTVSNSSGTGSAQITLSVLSNSGLTDRIANVTVSATGLPDKTVKVTQSAAPLPLTLPIDFESGSYSFVDFNGGTGSVINNPYPSGINTSNRVARIIRNGGATWAGSYLLLAGKIDFSAGTTFKMKIYSPKSGTQVHLKLEGDAGAVAEVQASTTMADSWENMSWDFSGHPSNTYNKLTFMFDFGVVGDGSTNSTFYFDDIVLGTNSVGLLNVSSGSLTISGQANSTKTFDITSNIGWTVLSDQTWLTSNMSGGSGNSTITLSATANPTIASRTAIVTVSGIGVVSQIITVSQEGGTTGVSDVPAVRFSIFPNPASAVLYINTLLDLKYFSIFDMNGKLVLNGKIVENQIKVDNLLNGMYSLRIDYKSGYIITKFIKQE